jgi:hypothetical protein
MKELNTRLTALAADLKLLGKMLDRLFDDDPALRWFDELDLHWALDYAVKEGRN